MGFLKNPFKGRQPGGNTATATPPTGQQQPNNQQAPDPNTGPLNGKVLQTAGDLNLVNYSSEELIKQVDDTLNRVQFGMSKSRRYMHFIGDIWANIAPWVLCIGTVGEVFAFLWISITTSTSTTTVNGKPVTHTTTNNPEWWVIVSILATIVALEATFAVVSFKSAAIRGDGEHKPSGPTDEDKKTIQSYRVFWFLLAFFVGIGQVAFLISSTTQNFSAGATAFFIMFAIIRTIGTMVGDYYTAFAHKETPTTADQAKAERDERADMGAKMLHDASRQVTILNEGTLAVMRAQTKGRIEQDELRTELTIKMMENQNRIDTMQSQAESAKLMSRMGNNLLRAAFDDQMSEQDRVRVLTSIHGLIKMNSDLPTKYQITEGDD